MEQVEFDQLKGWSNDTHLDAFRAFCVSAAYMIHTPYKSRQLGLDADQLAMIAKRALQNKLTTDKEARDFFQEHFQPFRVSPESDSEQGFLTGYFEPVVEASREKNERFSVPLYKQPPELVEIKKSHGSHSLPEDFRFARLTDSGLEEFYDRPSINEGALEGRNLELAWLRDHVDAFFIHVQGSAKLALADGDTIRVTYAAKSGHPYTSLGKVLCDRLSIPTSQMTADRLKDWMLGNPDQLPELLAQNKSYIFFREVDGLDANDGPVAAAKVPLVAGRSLAVDRTLHTFGTPLWIATKRTFPGGKAPLQRLMIAHDTGSAITGPARGDIYVGSGEKAGLIAGKVQHAADFYLLVPKS